jgi:hypothetical protein
MKMLPPYEEVKTLAKIVALPEKKPSTPKICLVCGSS